MTEEARGDGRLAAARLVPWLVGALWAALPFTAGPALADALSGASRPVQLVASAGLWLGWAAGMLAAAVPHPVALTALRVLSPGVVAAVVAGAAGGHPSALAAGWSVVVTAWAYSPVVGARCVNGPAYPNERRFLLRVPGPLLFGPLALAWMLAVAGAGAGPLLLAARRWVAGGVATAVGVPVAVVLVRSIHNLSRRWAVFVPAGVVLHDPLALVDPVLFRRRSVAALQPATLSPKGVDLSQGAPGLALELLLTEAVELSLMKPGRREGRPETATRVVFTPTRPGAVLAEARTRRLRVG
ncbi:MAG: hypothetical protein ABR511_03160 [Acidimicrobiales bacterium]